ncbi:MAG: MoxR family ATPase, partial [Planctomycetes bacterium]|nr:MoxR family ATPase [Planctomycetota bacterium]
KTQSALLEAMQERQVTAGQVTYPLPAPFVTIATQNPIEQEGTYPLPEAQLDRFMFSIHVDYPSLEEEEDVLAAATVRARSQVAQVLSRQDLLRFQEVVDRVIAPRFVISYATRLVRATRPGDPASPDFVRRLVTWGAGPRAGQYLVLGAKALAAMEGRPNASTQDIRRAALPVLRHRLSTSFQAQAEEIDAAHVVRKLVAEVPEPTA